MRILSGYPDDTMRMIPGGWGPQDSIVDSEEALRAPKATQANSDPVVALRHSPGSSALGVAAAQAIRIGSRIYSCSGKRMGDHGKCGECHAYRRIRVPVVPCYSCGYGSAHWIT